LFHKRAPFQGRIPHGAHDPVSHRSTHAVKTSQSDSVGVIRIFSGYRFCFSFRTTESRINV
jgi:hypothetical protein